MRRNITTNSNSGKSGLVRLAMFITFLAALAITAMSCATNSAMLPASQMRVTSMETSLATLNGQVQGLQAAVENHTAHLTALDGQVAQAQATAEEAKATAQATAKTVKALAGRIGNLEVWTEEIRSDTTQIMDSEAWGEIPYTDVYFTSGSGELDAKAKLQLKKLVLSASTSDPKTLADGATHLEVITIEAWRSMGGKVATNAKLGELAGLSVYQELSTLGVTEIPDPDYKGMTRRFGLSQAGKNQVVRVYHRTK